MAEDKIKEEAPGAFFGSLKRNNRQIRDDQFIKKISLLLGIKKVLTNNSEHSNFNKIKL